MTIKTASGFTCEVRDKAFDDYRVVRYLSTIEAAKEGKTESGEALVATTGLFSRLLGDEQEEALIAHLEDISDDGIATFTAMYAEINSIMAALQESKKNV